MTEYFRALDSHARAERLAIIDPPNAAQTRPVQHTYGQLLDRTTVVHEHLAEAARSSGRQLEGARVGLMLPPGADFVASVLGIWSVKAILVTICLTHPLPEIRYTVTNSDADFVIYHPSFEARIQSLLKDRIGISITDIPKDARPERKLDFSTLDLPSDAPCQMIHTSGTTGPPKGALTTFHGLESRLSALATVWEMSPEDRLLHVLPLHHGHGLTNALVLPLWVGSTIEFLPKFDEDQVWQRFLSSAQPITVFMAVPTIWVKMISYFNKNFRNDPALAEKAKKAAAALRLAISGSAALPVPIRQAWAEIANGYLLLERYGTSETGITFSGTLKPGGRIQGSVGWPLPGVQTRLMTDDGKDASKMPGVVGEIQIKLNGPVEGYWRRPDATAKSITPDGWWRTGDLGLVKAEHNNALFIQGRASVDIIKSGGFKISALEIETELLGLPFIQEAAVLGVEDPVWGEAVAAVCAPVQGKADELTIANLRAKLRDSLAPYKLPQKLHVLDAIPRNPMGKVQKKELKNLCFPTLLDSKL